MLSKILIHLKMKKKIVRGKFLTPEMFKIKQTACEGEDTGAGKPLMWKCSFSSDVRERT